MRKNGIPKVFHIKLKKLCALKNTLPNTFKNKNCKRDFNAFFRGKNFQ